MATDKNNPEESEAAQPTESKQPVNPFRDAAATGTPPASAAETDLEQQRKEAMTERD